MRLRFTKMQGAGNDFVVLDATRQPLELDTTQMQHLADRRFGVGADQILLVERSANPDLHFRYRIFNGASGQEVEHCGNGARCLARYVRDRGLTDADVIRVETINNRLELQVQPDGRVTVDMNRPVFDLDLVPFDASGLSPRTVGRFELWPLEPEAGQATMHQGGCDDSPGEAPDGSQPLEVAVLSMGNPHAVMRVDDVDTAPVARLGPWLEQHRRFRHKVNAGFMQVMGRSAIRLRVHERDAGETLACGTGACAAVVAGIRLGWLDDTVDVHARGGLLGIQWRGAGYPVMMTGPAQTVYEGEITL